MLNKKQKKPKHFLLMTNQEAAVGFEPTDNGFANRRLWPLGYAAVLF
jgi:hypothetical protein